MGLQLPALVAPPRAARLRWRATDDDGCAGVCNSGYIIYIVVIALGILGFGAGVFAWMCSIKRQTGRWGFRRPLGPGHFGAQGRAARHGEASQYPQYDAENDPVPAYNATLTPDDAGHYDAQGNYQAFEPPPYEPTKALVRTETLELSNLSADELARAPSRPAGYGTYPGDASSSSASASSAAVVVPAFSARAAAAAPATARSYSSAARRSAAMFPPAGLPPAQLNM